MFKTFQDGVKLYGAEVNDYLMKQVILRFADLAALEAAVTSPETGMVAYLSDGTGLVMWDGTQWGSVTVNRVRISGTDDVDASSTTHGLQIGSHTAANLRMDNNEVIAANNGTPTTLLLNVAAGGNVRMGGLEAGSVVVPTAASSQATQAVTFTTNRFSVAPTVVISVRTSTSAGSVYSKLNAKAQSVTATGFTAVINTGDGSAMSAGNNMTCDWIAYEHP